MKIRINDLKKVLKPSDYQSIERRFSYAISPFKSKIEHLSVVINDTNGPKGGYDKLCKVYVKLKYSSKKLVISCNDDNLHSCYSKAAKKCSRAISKALGRKQSFEKQTLHELLTAELSPS